MGCPTTIIEIASSCGSNLPGVKTLAIGNFGDYSYTYKYYKADGTETADPAQAVLDADGNPIKSSISAATIEGGGSAMTTFAFRKNTASATNTLTVNDNGTNFYTNAITCYFPKQDTFKRLSIMSLVQGETCALVEDKNGKWWLYGHDEYLSVSEQTTETGASPSDSNGYNVTLSVDEKALPLPVSTSAMQTMLGIQTYTVSISAGSNGTVAVNGISGNYSQSVVNGTVLTLTATGDAGYEFDQWSDSDNTNPRTLTVSADVTLTASFQVE